MKAELDVSLGLTICSPLDLETKLYFIETIDRRMITSQGWKDTDKRFADLNGLRMNNNWPLGVMIIN